MRRRLPFALRTAVLTSVLGLILSLLFAAAVVHITERYEHVLVAALLQDQADTYAARLAADPSATLASSERMHARLQRVGSPGAMPAPLAALPPGIHEFRSGSLAGTHVGVFDTRAGRLYLSVDLADVETLERFVYRTLAWVVALGTLLSAALGAWLARGITQPVRQLADAVEALPPFAQDTALARHIPHDVLGRLARAIDGYQARLLEAEQDKMRFFADASHELRTPLAVVRGAAELLNDDIQALPALQRPAQRLQRGLDHLALLLDVMLRLARRQLAPSESVNLDDWMAGLLPRLVAQHPGIRLHITGQGGLRSLALRDAELVVTGLVRELLARTPTGTLHVQLASDSWIATLVSGSVANPTASPEAFGAASVTPNAPSSDRQITGTLLAHLAQAHGWRLQEAGHASHQRIGIAWTEPTERDPAFNAA